MQLIGRSNVIKRSKGGTDSSFSILSHIAENRRDSILFPLRPFYVGIVDLLDIAENDALVRPLFGAPFGCTRR